VAKRKLHKGLAMALTLALALYGAAGKPGRIGIILLSCGIAVCLIYAFSGWAWARRLGVAERIGRAFVLLVGCCGVAAWYGWQFWPSPPAQTSDDSSHAVGFQALDTEIGNLPERQKVSLTWNGKRWDEQQYSDVRLTINNNLDYQIQNSDLAISAMDGEEHLGIAGIGQLSDVSGVEFHPPLTQWPQLRLRGKDGKDYVFDATDMLGNKWLPAREFRIFCPRLLPNEPLRLIIATVRDNGNKKPATSLHIKGTYETAQSEGSMRRKLDQTIVIEQ